MRLFGGYATSRKTEGFSRLALNSYGIIGTLDECKPKAKHESSVSNTDPLSEVFSGLALNGYSKLSNRQVPGRICN